MRHPEKYTRINYKRNQTYWGIERLDQY